MSAPGIYGRQPDNDELQMREFGHIAFVSVIYIIRGKLVVTAGDPMAHPKSLTKMSLEALVELRDSVTATISEKATDLQKQLSRLTGTVARNGATRGRKRSSALRG